MDLRQQSGIDQASCVEGLVLTQFRMPLVQHRDDGVVFAREEDV
jgi:hypothetical protein